MARIQMGFKKITVALDEVARARLCQSSGSEHSEAENSVTDLSDLVDSFLERDGMDVEGISKDGEEKKKKNEREEGRGCSESESDCTDSETKEMLRSLIGGETGAKEMIRAELEMACRSLGINGSSEGFKRQVMSWLRQRGFDAGLCKSRWEKTARHPAGEYEYIDIIAAGTRYIVQVSPTTEFTIARPTKQYKSLLGVLPQVLVCKEGELKQVVRLMCAAMRESLKKRDMHVPPWRTNGYMQGKWFGSYKRTKNPVPKTQAPNRAHGSVGQRLVGFETSPTVQYFHCRDEVFSKVGLNVGNLKAVLNGMT